MLDKKIQYLYLSLNIISVKIMMLRWAGHMEKETHRSLAGNPEGEKLLGRSKHTWYYNIKWVSRKNARKA
jgi:hypothetical protein